jgi:hypothetical protein
MVITFVVDFAWAVYIQSLAENKYTKAAMWSSFITLTGFLTIISYVENHWLVFPAIIGGAVGTYCSQYFKK